MRILGINNLYLRPNSQIKIHYLLFITRIFFFVRIKYINIYVLLR